mmetsp:Transcript_3508/g.10158  ORF Transcript_3508/g.10158 Transcript_3508/m.10158 type:complete len:293 (-) Transcript_3508:922-1800(-)
MRLPAIILVLSLCVAVGSIQRTDADIRRLLAREMPLATCANTVQGRWYVTDDRGYHCSRTELDPATGCCTKGERYSCHTCSEDDECCTEFERCVSCCMAPVNKADEKVLEVFRGPGREETGRWGNKFEYCRGKCRTHKFSTVHENAYLAPDIHCYSDLGKPLTDESPVPPLAEGVALVPGADGDSCDQACQAIDPGLICVATAMPSTNSCNVLREHFGCEAGCGEHPMLAGLPGYTVSGADKAQQPTFCWTQPKGQVNATALHGCDTSNPDIQRLCPCSKSNAAVVAIVSLR